ncbi:MAG: hypothetical protein HUJ62_07685 [Streptococcus gallolyticus]|nr:hypothetical protein [Streptococcus gallolyticus]
MKLYLLSKNLLKASFIFSCIFASICLVLGLARDNINLLNAIFLGCKVLFSLFLLVALYKDNLLNLKIFSTALLISLLISQFSHVFIYLFQQGLTKLMMLGLGACLIFALNTMMLFDLLFITLNHFFLNLKTTDESTRVYVNQLSIIIYFILSVLLIVVSINYTETVMFDVGVANCIADSAFLITSGSAELIILINKRKKQTNG